MSAERISLDELAALDAEIAMLTRTVDDAVEQLDLARMRLNTARARQARLIDTYHRQAVGPLVDDDAR